VEPKHRNRLRKVEQKIFHLSYEVAKGRAKLYEFVFLKVEAIFGSTFPNRWQPFAQLFLKVDKLFSPYIL
jgi:hypothetical protein